MEENSRLLGIKNVIATYNANASDETRLKPGPPVLQTGFKGEIKPLDF